LCPSVFDVDPQVYRGIVEEIKRFLHGGYKAVEKQLKKEMNEAAEAMAFERAAELRDQIQAIDTTMVRQKMSNTDFVDSDVLGYAVDKGWMCVQVFLVRDMKLIERDVSMFPFYNEPEEDFLTFLGQFYRDNRHLAPKEVLLPENIEMESAMAVVPTKALQPQRGEIRKLVALAGQNAAVS